MVFLNLNFNFRTSRLRHDQINININSVIFQTVQTGKVFFLIHSPVIYHTNNLHPFTKLISLGGHGFCIKLEKQVCLFAQRQ